MNQNWSTKSIGEICEIINGSTPRRSEKKYWDRKDIPWFTIRDIRLQGRRIRKTEQYITNLALSNTSLRLLPKNSILLCCTASVGEYAITEIPLTTNQQFNGLIIKNDKEVIPNYLFWFCSTIKRKLLELSGKTTIDFIPISKLRDIRIPIPPLPEQQRIVAQLDQSFTAVDAAKKNNEKSIQNVRELFDSYLDKIINSLNLEEDLFSLGDVCNIARGGSPRPISSYLTEKPDGINWIKIGDTKNVRKYIYKTKQKIRPEGKKKSRFVKEGDLILSNSMSFGHPYILKTNGCIHDGWLVLKQKIDSINNEFLFYILGSKYVYSQFNRLATGSTVRNLNINWVKKVEIPIPSFEKQIEIVQLMDNLSQKIDSLEEIYHQENASLEELRQSISQKAFSGNL